jgi:hypothetical protein
MIYECAFCHRKFDKKYNYDRHRRHVKYCVENKTIPLVKKPEVKEQIREKCENCGKTFKNKFTLKRHQLKNCEKIEEINTSELPTQEETEFKKMITKTIDEIKKEDNVVVANITINNYPNQKNTIKQTNIINNYNMNAFGKEDLSHITDEVIKNIFNNPSSSVIRMIKEIHFNEQCPENMNVRQPNLKINLVDLFNGVDWEKHNKEDVIHNLIASKKDILDDVVEKINIEDLKKEEYSKFSNELDQALYKSMIKHVEDNKSIQKYNTMDTKILKPISTGISHILANRKSLK